MKEYSESVRSRQDPLYFGRKLVGDETPRLELRSINKSFPGVRALTDMSIRFRRAAVHVICGENGAGKSTLMKIVNGLHQPDSGEI